MSSYCSRPSFLNPTSSPTSTDRPILETEFPQLWGYVAGLVVRLIRRSLGSVSLHRAERLASGAGEARMLLADVRSVREALRGDLVDDLQQEVAIVLLQSIRKGRLRASEHVVRAWLRTTVKFVVRGQIRQPATLCFAAGNPSPDTGDSEDEPSTARSRTDLNDLVRERDHLRWLAAVLRPEQFALLQARAEGQEYEDLAVQFDLVTEGNARVAVHRAKRAALKALEAPETGSLRPKNVVACRAKMRRAA